MLNITLPDGSTLEFPEPVTVREIVNKIGPGLAKAALAAEVDGQLVELSAVVAESAALKIITAKDPEALEIIRHSTAHLLAHAVKQLYPAAKITIGPVIEDGFYYDISLEHSFTPDDLEKIEKRMVELAKQDLSINRKEATREDAIELFNQRAEDYKVEIVSAIPAGERITLYEQGEFIDPCRGPHVPSTGKLKAFKLTKLAGAYWRGDPNNEMLQRIYGTAWADKKQLQEYLDRLEEAKKRDHRLLGKQMELFHFQEEAPGMVFWHHSGWMLCQQIIHYMRNSLYKANYQEVATPLFLDRSLWEQSGHCEKFADNMFTCEVENRVYAVKPMNCPGNIQIFKQGVTSYRELPIKIGEFGLCHRNEPSGTLFGLMRTRQFTQDDAHIYCTEEQLAAEIDKVVDLLYETYNDFGFSDILVRLATRPDKRIGADEDWDRAEKVLQTTLDKRKIKWELASGEGAFYGPKHEYHLRDCLGRVWQCGTIQVDFSMPKRLGAQYVAEDGSKKTPIMIHRAILGSIERFIAILLEHYAGVLPLWLAPVQVAIMNITGEQAEYATEISENLQKHALRVKLDLRNEKIGFKIREHTIKKVPYLIVVGNREVEQRTVAVRAQSGEDLGSKSLAEFSSFLQEKSSMPGELSTGGG